MLRHLRKKVVSMPATQILPVDKASIQIVGDTVTVSDETTLRHLARAAESVKVPGSVVAFPTETVYGLGGSALNDQSVKAIYTAKRRPADNPLIVHVSGVEQLERIIMSQLHRIPKIYEKLIDKFWPGPLTILVPLEAQCPVLGLVTTGQDTVGIRVPEHAVARALIAMSDTPLAAPSANASTRPSPTLATHVQHDLDGRIPCILDGGACAVGVESTVVNGLCTPPMILRPGGVSVDDIKQYGGAEWRHVITAKKSAGKSEPVRTPGMKYRHYSPTAKVVLFTGCGDGVTAVANYMAGRPEKVAVLRSLHFASAHDMGLQPVLERSMGTSCSEVARNLFRDLRDADEAGVDLILVEAVDEEGDGLAVMNRLSKAASETVTG